MRFCVVGHVEWVEFARVPRMPAAGEIVHATERWDEPAGGGAVVAAQLARLGAETVFVTALGQDELGRRAKAELAARGIDVRVQWRDEPTRRGVHPRRRGGRADDHRPRRQAACRAGRSTSTRTPASSSPATSRRCDPPARAGFLAATAREAATLRAGAVPLDLLVGSASDPGECADGIDAPLVVLTDGAAGGLANGRRYPAAPLPGPVADAYGCGDSFAAALAFALARGDDLDAALALAARAGAAVITGKGPYAAQIAG